MEIPQSVSVMYVAFMGFVHRQWTALTHRAIPPAKPLALDWLGDDETYTGETQLSEDLESLRFLEAELYTLNDQFKTETGQLGPIAS